MAVAAERVGITGNYPVYAETPLQDEFLAKDAREAAKHSKTIEEDS
jgi:L-asparagine permease